MHHAFIELVNSCHATALKYLLLSNVGIQSVKFKLLKFSTAHMQCCIKTKSHIKQSYTLRRSYAHHLT